MSEVVRSDTDENWPAILTWRAPDGAADGVGARTAVRQPDQGQRPHRGGCDDGHPAFSASYDLVTDDQRRHQAALAAVTLAAARAPALDRARRGGHVDGPGRTRARPSVDSLDGALDVDLILSPFFNALPIRRFGLQTQGRRGLAARGLRPRARADGRAEVSPTPGQAADRRPASRCSRRSPTPPSPSTTTGSSSTTPAWQSASDHPAGASRGGQFGSASLRSRRRTESIGGRAIAVVAHAARRAPTRRARPPNPCSRQAVRARSAVRWRGRGRAQLAGVRLAHRAHQLGGGGRDAGAVAERARGQRERQRHVRPP